MFVSTSEKLGWLDELELPPLADEGEDEDDGVLDEEDEDGLLVELLPLDDDGDVAEGVLDEDDGLLDEDEDDWATASDDSASITAAAVTPRVLGIRSPGGGRKTTPGSPQALCRMSEGTPSDKPAR